MDYPYSDQGLTAVTAVPLCWMIAQVLRPVKRPIDKRTQVMLDLGQGTAVTKRRSDTSLRREVSAMGSFWSFFWKFMICLVVLTCMFTIKAC